MRYFHLQETQMSEETKTDGGLTIASVDIKNYKRIKCVKFDPKEAGLTTLGGMNRAGKTSNLNAIQMGFSGGKHRPSDLHNDTGGPGDYADVKITTTNGYKVRIHGKNGTVEVTDPKGIKGGIALFGDAVSSFATDLRPFINANATDKYKIAVLAMGIGELLETLEVERKTAYTARTVANGIKTKAKAALEVAVEPGKDVEIPKEVDIVKLSAQITKANKDNDDRTQLEHDQAEFTRNRQTLAETIEELEDDLKAHKCNLVDKDAEIAKFKPIPKVIDLDPMNAKMATANETNKERTTLRKVKTDYQALVLASGDAHIVATKAQAALSAVLEKKNNAVNELGEISNPDITLESGQVLYKGKAWDCLAGVEEFIVAIEMGAATNKGCNFVLVDGLEGMDPVERGKLDDWGSESGVQLIGTVVTGDPSQCTVYIEDGKVVDKEE